jgi:hypothetical protein
VRVTHPRLLRALRGGVCWAEAERTFVVQLGHFRGWLDVEDTAFWVDAYDAASGEIALSDRTSESLDAETLSADADDCLRCTVKQRFPARFTRSAQAELLASIDVEDGQVAVRAGHELRAAPQLTL